MKVEEYQNKFAEMRKTLREDIKNVLTEHELTSLNFDDIRMALEKQPFDEVEDVCAEMEEFRQNNVISVYYKDGQSFDCYIDEVSINNNDISFRASDCYYDKNYPMQVSYDTMELFYLYALVVGFFESFNYDNTTKLITLK